MQFDTKENHNGRANRNCKCWLDLRSVLLSSCWWAIEVGFGIWEPDPGLLLPGRVPYGTCPLHTSIFHHHPSLFPPLLRWAPNGTLFLDGEASALFHPQDSWKVPHPLLVSLKYASVAIGWMTVQKKKKKGWVLYWESDVSLLAQRAFQLNLTHSC